MSRTIQTKVEKSSLGTNHAKAARRTVSAERAAQVIAHAVRARENSRKAGG